MPLAPPPAETAAGRIVRESLPDPDVPPPGATGERMTAAAFLSTAFPDDRPRELVKGWVVIAADWMADRPAFCQTPPVPPPGARHGRTCLTAAFPIEAFGRRHGCGQVFINDTAVTTEEAGSEDERDSVRGGDVLFYGVDRLPLDAPLPDGPLDDPPDLVLETRSPSDRPGQFREKAAEYLNAGVTLVGWLDPRRRTLTLFDDPAADDLGERVLAEADVFTPGPFLPGFSCTVAELLGS